MLQDLTDNKSTLNQVIAGCHRAINHSLTKCWPRYMTPYGAIMLRWVQTILTCQSSFHGNNFFIRVFIRGVISYATLTLLKICNPYVSKWYELRIHPTRDYLLPLLRNTTYTIRSDSLRLMKTVPVCIMVILKECLSVIHHCWVDVSISSMIWYWPSQAGISHFAKVI